jgi:hypothetical protein
MAETETVVAAEIITTEILGITITTQTTIIKTEAKPLFLVNRNAD